jgi:chaperonin GroEL (HSP60 family)
LDLFAKRDITNDTEMRELATKTKAIMAMASPNALRDDDKLRTVMAEAMTKVKSRIDGMIESEKRRKFDL